MFLQGAFYFDNYCNNYIHSYTNTTKQDVMKKILLSLLAFIAAFTTSAQKAPKEKTLLWQISGNGLEQPSYLFGTFHLMCTKDFLMPDTVKAAFSQTKQLYLEIDLADKNMQKKMMQTISMKDGHKLKDYISEKEYDSANKIFESIAKVPLNMVSTYKPFMLTSMLYPAMLGCNTIAFEKEFEKMAKVDSMEILGLETLEDQMQVFDKIPYKKQAKALVKNLFTFDEQKKNLQELVVTYKSKNIAAMQSKVNKDTDFKKYEKLLLANRNKNWIPVIAKAAATKQTFFAVGAGHLGGKKGVITLLRKQGFTVTPIMY